MANPLTMTPEREAWYRSPEGIACAPLYTPDLLAELDATRAKLAEAGARVAALTEALSKTREWLQSAFGSEGAASMYRKLNSARGIIDATKEAKP